MLKMTTDHLRQLLGGPSERPVLYVARDSATGEPVQLAVWDEGYVYDHDIVVRRHELVDALGGPDHPDGVTDAALEHLLEGFQAEIDAMEEDSEADDACCEDLSECRHDAGDGPCCLNLSLCDHAVREPDGVHNGEIR